MLIPRGREAYWSTAPLHLSSKSNWVKQMAIQAFNQAAAEADIVLMIDPRAATLSLLARRAPDATICPSEVARAILPDWRSAMPGVHAAVDGLVRDGLVRLSWKGQTLVTRSGPYRIGRPGNS